MRYLVSTFKGEAAYRTEEDEDKAKGMAEACFSDAYKVVMYFPDGKTMIFEKGGGRGPRVRN